MFVIILELPNIFRLVVNLQVGYVPTVKRFPFAIMYQFGLIKAHCILFNVCYPIFCFVMAKSIFINLIAYKFANDLAVPRLRFSITVVIHLIKPFVFVFCAINIRFERHFTFRC